MATSDLFKMSKIWKHPGCHLVGEWINCGVYSTNERVLSPEKKGAIKPQRDMEEA